MVRIQRFNMPVVLMIVLVIVVVFVFLVLISSGARNMGFAPQQYAVQAALQQGQQGQQMQQAGQQYQQAGNAAGDVDTRGVFNELELSNRETGESLEGRIILRNATLRIVVDDPQAALSEVAGLAEEFGGWVVNSSVSRVTTASGVETARGSITIRVLAERLDEALDRIKSSATSVETEAVSGQDVTQQYIDLTSRLNNLQAAETQLQSIMEEARRTEDVLNVYSQLVNIRGEIETLQGQIQYYDESAAFSSISVELVPQALETPIQIAGWSPEGTARGAFLALLNVLRFLVDAAITLIVLVLPLILIFGIPGRWVYRRVRRNRQAASG